MWLSIVEAFPHRLTGGSAPEHSHLKAKLPRQTRHAPGKLEILERQINNDNLSVERIFRLAKRTRRAAQHYWLLRTRNSTEPTAGRDHLMANETFLLPGILTLHHASLLFRERGLPNSNPSERVVVA